MRKVTTGTTFELANHLTFVAYLISYKKWVQREKCPFKDPLTLGQ